MNLWKLLEKLLITYVNDDRLLKYCVWTLILRNTVFRFATLKYVDQTVQYKLYLFIWSQIKNTSEWKAKEKYRMIPQKICICTISVIKCLHFDLMLKSLRGEIYNYRFFPLKKKKKHLKVYTFFKIQFQNKSLAFFPQFIGFYDIQNLCHHHHNLSWEPFYSPQNKPSPN